MKPVVKKMTVNDAYNKYGSDLNGMKIYDSHFDGLYVSTINLGNDAKLTSITISTNDTNDLETWHSDMTCGPGATIELYKPQPQKTPFELLDLDFAAAMCDCWQAGIKDGRKADDWKALESTPENICKYRAKVIRHLHNYDSSSTVEEAQKHAAAIACNACILWELAEK